MKDNNKQNIELAVHKEKFKQIESDISNIKTNLNNHVADIYKQLTAHKNWLIGILTAIILTLIGTIINFLK